MPKYPKCIFCEKNTSPLSQEDVLAKWIAREFPQGRLSRFFGQVGIPGQPPNRKFATRGHFGILTNKQCERCNNGWMSDLENEVKPIIRPMFRGGKQSLSASDRLVIARWLTKTAMTYELSARFPTRYFKPSDRRAMYTHRTIPDGTVMFLARYVGKHSVVARAGRADLTFASGTPRELHANGYTATFGIGQLALQVFSIRRPEQFNMPIKVTIPGRWDSATVEIWPQSRLGNMDWPPRVALNDKSLELFENRWDTVGH
jgi:hypothetical protein